MQSYIQKLPQTGGLMLEIQGLSKSYGNNVAVDNVDFTVPDGQVGILLGPNGAGKSTIIKSIAGLLSYKGKYPDPGTSGTHH